MAPFRILDLVRSRLALSFLAGMVVAGATGAVLVMARDGDSTEERAAARRYLESIEPLARAGGEVVQLGLKPGITDLGKNDYNRSLLATQTAAWLRDLQSVRTEWSDLDPPEGWGAIQAGFLRALNGYVAAASSLKEAVGRARPEREELVAAAVDAGENADDIWDKAAASLQKELEHLHLEPVTWLPRG